MEEIQKTEEQVMVTIIDSIMGSGKTSWAIKKMQEDTENKYIYITPYLDEVDRIVEHCKDRRFYAPMNYPDGKKKETKLEDLHTLIGGQANIATTHALFRKSNENTINILKSNDYVLILDEVMDVVQEIYLRDGDIQILFDMDLISVNPITNIVKWNEDKENFDSKYNEIRDSCRLNSVFFVNKKMMMWTFPIEMFTAFKEVYILTYMFRGQIQKYYYDLYKLKYNYQSTRMVDGVPNLIDYIDKDDLSDIKKLITIIENDKINIIGDSNYALSKTWYDNQSDNPDKSMIKQMRLNIQNYYINKSKSKNADNMWTTFKTFEQKVSAPSYKKGFVSVGARATNQYKDKWALAYGVNIFMNPVIRNFFVGFDVKVDDETYALSELIQWIWRSRIREGKEIIIYIPSKRMRDIFIGWLNSM